MSLNLNYLQTVTRQRKSTSCLLQYANNNRNQGRFNDVTIQSNDISIPANRMVLSCYCSFFDERFATETNNQIHNSIVDISDVDENSLELLIQYIYTGQICIDSDNVLDILEAAHHLELDEVKEFCFEFLESCLTPDNCIPILITAKKHENFTLRDKVYSHISHNYETITKTPAFLNLDNEELFFIVFHLKTRYYVNDEVLCRSLLSWTKQDEATRKQHFHNKLIKFVKIDQFPFWLIKYLLKESLIQENIEYYKILKDRIIKLRTKTTKMISIGDTMKNKKVKVIYTLKEETNEIYPDLPISLQYRSIKTNEFVYAIGGKDSNEYQSNKAFRLNLSEKRLKWEQIASMNVRRDGHSVAMLYDTIVVCGGNDGSKSLSSAEAYNATLNKWKNIKPLNQHRDENQSATACECLYTMGGYDGMNNYLSSVERLDGLDQSWKSVSSMQISRSSFAAVTCNDFIYAIGGYSGFKYNYLGLVMPFVFPLICRNVLKSVEKYDCAADKWIYVSEMNIERHGHSACVMQGKIFVVGGRNAHYKPVKEIECYNPSTDKWEIVARIDNELFDRSLVAL